MGAVLGAEVVGASVVVGASLGLTLGRAVGDRVVGLAVGRVVGLVVGLDEGALLGAALGSAVGRAVLGFALGLVDGSWEVGPAVVGARVVGALVLGAGVGSGDGDAVLGASVGAGVTTFVGALVTDAAPADAIASSSLNESTVMPPSVPGLLSRTACATLSSAPVMALTTFSAPAPRTAAALTENLTTISNGFPPNNNRRPFLLTGG